MKYIQLTDKAHARLKESAYEKNIPMRELAEVAICGFIDKITAPCSNNKDQKNEIKKDKKRGETLSEFWNRVKSY